MFEFSRQKFKIQFWSFLMQKSKLWKSWGKGKTFKDLARKFKYFWRENSTTFGMKIETFGMKIQKFWRKNTIFEFYFVLRFSINDLPVKIVQFGFR